MAKVVNYTVDQEKTLSELYRAASDEAERSEVVADMAASFGKSTRSIIAKLSRMGVYVKPERKDKSGAPVVKKDSLATTIGEFLQLAESDTDSLAKANKRALKAIANALNVDGEADETEADESVNV